MPISWLSIFHWTFISSLPETVLSTLISNSKSYSCIMNRTVYQMKHELYSQQIETWNVQILQIFTFQVECWKDFFFMIRFSVFVSIIFWKSTLYCISFLAYIFIPCNTFFILIYFHPFIWYYIKKFSEKKNQKLNNK